MALRRIVLAAALAGLSCTSPTLPLPPPALPSISLGIQANEFVLKSDRGALPNALVVIVNRNTALPNEDRVAGTIADNVGSWQATVKGAAGDVVDTPQDDGLEPLAHGHRRASLTDAYVHASASTRRATFFPPVRRTTGAGASSTTSPTRS